MAAVRTAMRIMIPGAFVRRLVRAPHKIRKVEKPYRRSKERERKTPAERGENASFAWNVALHCICCKFATAFVLVAVYL